MKVNFVPFPEEDTQKTALPLHRRTEEDIMLELIEFRMDPEVYFNPVDMPHVAYEIDHDLPTTNSIAEQYTWGLWNAYHADRTFSKRGIHMSMRKENYLIWDVVVRGEDHTNHAGAWYYGYFHFSGRGYFLAPKFTLCTPNGIYTSQTEKHFIAKTAEPWNSTTTVIELMTGLINFLLYDCRVIRGGMCAHGNCPRRARESFDYNLTNRTFLTHCTFLASEIYQFRANRQQMAIDGEETDRSEEKSRKRKGMHLDDYPLTKQMFYLDCEKTCDVISRNPDSYLGKGLVTVDNFFSLLPDEEKFTELC